MLEGKICVVTGATGGIGLETARGLARLGAQVGLVGRSAEKGKAALAALAGLPGPSPLFFRADLSQMVEVRAVAAEICDRFERIDVLVNNAGAIFSRREVTAEGYERTFATNHLAPFLLTGLVLDHLKRSAPSRIVNVASSAHIGARIHLDDLQTERFYWSFRAYARSKLANLYFTFELARRLAGTGVTVNAVHPGVVGSNFARENGGIARFFFLLARPFLISSEKGAETSLYAATAPELEGVSGRYFYRSRETDPAPHALDQTIAAGLWDRSEAMTDFPYAGALLPQGLLRPSPIPGGGPTP